MKKLFILLPAIIGLSGCVAFFPELQEFEKQYQKMLEEADLIGVPKYSRLFEELWGNTPTFECGPLHEEGYRNGKFTIEGARVDINTHPEKCEPYLSNLKYYIKHKKTKAQQNRENAEKQKVIQARKQEEKNKAYAKEQYKLAQQAHDSNERLSHLENASASGNPQASYDLFKYYLPVNELLADQYLKKAAFDGHAEANLIMGGRFAKSAKYRFSDNIHAYVYYKRAERYGNKTGATLAKGIENRFKARIQQGNSEAEYLWRNAQRMASF